MAYEEAVKRLSAEASADLSTYQYCGVKLNSSGQLALAGEGDAAVGVLQDKPAAAGRAGAYAISGVTKVLCGATLSAGDRVSFNSVGRAIGVGSGNDWSMGIMTSAGTAGTIGSMLIQPTGPTV